MSEISVVVVGSTAINSVVGNGDTVNVSVGAGSGGNGSAATIQVGTVTTLEPTQTATVVNDGTAYAAKLNFGIPRGNTGPVGPAGPVATLKIGTVQTGVDAGATITGSGATQTLNLVLPQGAQGEKGDTGNTGPAGPPNALSVGEVSVTTAATAAVSITGSAPSQQISFVIPRGPQGVQGEPGPFTTIQVGSTTTGNPGTQAKVDTVSAGGTITLNFTIPKGYDGTSNLGDETPQPLGVASAGSATVASRADHRHPLPVIAYSSLSGVPTTFAPSAHTHAISEVTNLQAVLDSKQPAGTYATLVGGTVPSSQLPGYVDDIVEVASESALPATGESGKLYVTVDNRRLWRWSGTGYVEIASSPGSTDSVPEGSTNKYFTIARAASAAPVQSVNGKVGDVVIEAGGIAWSSAPTSTTTVTKAGNISYDENYLYVANATDQWRRAPIEDWTTPTITISVQPSDQTAVGGTATFSVNATATQNAELLYQWQRQAGGVGSWVNIATGLSATLELVDLVYATNNGDKYRVVISSGAAGTGGTAVNGWLPAVVVELTPTATVTSNAATLTVSAAISIVSQPQNVSLTSGTSASFSVTATTPGTGLSYQWQSSPDGTNWTNISGATSATYAITGITETANDQYRYRCVVSSSGYDDVTSNAALLDVAPITVTSQPTNKTGTPVAGTTPNYAATFTSAATSPAGSPTIQWEVSTDGGTSYSDVSGQTNSSLSLTGLTTSDSGKKYRAKFEKTGWNTVRSNAATLTVPTDVISVTQQPSNTTASVSQFSSTVFGVPSGSWNDASYAGGKWWLTPSNQDFGGDYIASSDDGVNWTKHLAALPVAGSWTKVVYYGGVWLTYRSLANSLVYATSTDGVSWTQRSLSFAPAAVVVLDGLGFFAIGSSFGAAYSADGANWTSHTHPGIVPSVAVTVAGSRVIVSKGTYGDNARVSVFGDMRTATVAGGVLSSWSTPAAAGLAFAANSNRSVQAFGTRVFVFDSLSSSGSSGYAYAINYADASPVWSGGVAPSGGFSAATWGGTRWVACVMSVDQFSGIWTSSDASSWAFRYSSAGVWYNIGAIGNRVLAANGSFTDGPAFVVSNDGGITWSSVSLGDGASFRSASGESFVAGAGRLRVRSGGATAALVDLGGVTAASFSSSATTTFGAPALQWQKSTDGGATWTNISGAVSSPLSLAPVSADNGAKYRAVYSKDSYATVNSNAATLTVP